MFNDYDANGYRINKFGCRSSLMEDTAIVRNLRFAYHQQVARFNDARLVDIYDEFAVSDYFGNNDERFIEWLALQEDL